MLGTPDPVMMGVRQGEIEGSAITDRPAGEGEPGRALRPAPDRVPLLSGPQEAVMPRWIFWTLLAWLSYGIWAVLSKLFGDSLTPAHGQALSTLGMLPVMAALALVGWGQQPVEAGRGSRRQGIFLAVLGGSLSCAGNIPYFSALAGGAKAATVVPITALYPLVTIVLAVPLLKERLNRVQGVGIGCSLAAIYLLNMQEESGLVSVWLPVAAVSIVLWGLAGLLQKLSTNHLTGTSSALWFLAAFVPAGLVIVVRHPLPAEIAWRTWFLALGLGTTLALGNLAVLVAYARDGKASIITPLVGLYPLVSIPIAILVLGEQVSGRELLGISLALISIGMISWESAAAPSAAASE